MRAIQGYNRTKGQGNQAACPGEVAERIWKRQNASTDHGCYCVKSSMIPVCCGFCKESGDRNLALSSCVLCNRLARVSLPRASSGRLGSASGKVHCPLDSRARCAGQSTLSHKGVS